MPKKLKPGEYRSGLEQKYANHLEYQRLAGEIQGWAYEPKTFVLGNHGTYTPDFEVLNRDNDLEYHEVKGWFRGIELSLYKWKEAADIFSMHRWFLVRYVRGAWKIKEYVNRGESKKCR
jgi:hypothetical protein